VKEADSIRGLVALINTYDSAITVNSAFVDLVMEKYPNDSSLMFAAEVAKKVNGVQMMLKDVTDDLAPGILAEIKEFSERIKQRNEANESERKVQQGN
jgi:hypothetical protein